MYLTVHAAAGLWLATYTANPIVAFFLGLISHFILDAIPHGDEHVGHGLLTRWHAIKRLVGATTIDGIILVFFTLIYIATTPAANTTIVLASLAGAILPDLLWGIYLLIPFRALRWYYNFHSSIHNPARHKMHWQYGIFIQVLIFTALWLMLV